VPKPLWGQDVLEQQIKQYRPDVLLIQVVDGLNPEFLRRIKSYVGLIVGQHAAMGLPEADYSAYELVLTSFPPTIEFFRSRGVNAQLLRLGFETELTALAAAHRDVPVSFVGSFLQIHQPRTQMLEYLASIVPLKVWGAPPGGGFGSSPLAACYQGEAYGQDMYKILGRSRIALNHHGDIAPFANNLRLYEATGMGALLITDWKENLHEMFEPGQEVIAYRSREECAEFIRYYLDHEADRAAIAAAGQQRTLREHTDRQRMQQLLDKLQPMLHSRNSTRYRTP
jgi:hypothetical protein